MINDYGLLSKITIKKEKDVFENKKVSRYVQFVEIISKGKTFLFRMNAFLLIFCLPAAVYFYFYHTNNLALVKTLPNDLNGQGIGYNIYSNPQKYIYQMIAKNNLSFVLLFSLLILLAGIGYSGTFYQMKSLICGKQFKLFSDYFRGFKNNFWKFFLNFCLIACGLIMLVFNINYNNTSFAYHKIGTFVYILLMVLSILFMYFTIAIAMFSTTQCITYKMGFFNNLKNSLIFSIKFIPKNVFMIAISFLPLIVFYFCASTSSVSLMILLFLVFWIGFSFMPLVWVLYAQSIFDKYINPYALDEVITVEDVSTEVNKKQSNKKVVKDKVRFKNPKKRKK